MNNERIIIEKLIKAGRTELAIESQREFWTNDKIFTGCIPSERVLEGFLTEDPDMLGMKKQTLRLSIEDYPVLVTGETGTGKEIIARALHGWRFGKFVAVNCTSMPDELIESELFGHVEGAFTGAIKNRKGKFEEALNGTLFLDEIGDMPLNMQTKLLRVLQCKKIVRVGDNIEIDVSSVRIVCATNKILSFTESFREDLFFRIATFVLRLKPLCERMGDVPLILRALAKDIPDSILEEILRNSGSLRGNVRELETIAARWKVFGKDFKLA